MAEHPVFTAQLLSKGIAAQFAAFQVERLKQEDHLIDALRYAMLPVKPLTRWQKAKRWPKRQVRHFRLWLAEKIAGDQWPQDW